MNKFTWVATVAALCVAVGCAVTPGHESIARTLESPAQVAGIRDATFVDRYREVAREISEGEGVRTLALAIASQILQFQASGRFSNFELLLESLADAPFAFDLEAMQVSPGARDQARALVWKTASEVITAHPERLDEAWGFISLALRQNVPVYQSLRLLNRPIFERSFMPVQFASVATCLAIDSKDWKEAGCLPYLKLFSLNSDPEYRGNAISVIELLQRVNRMSGTPAARHFQALLLATVSSVGRPSGLKALSK